MSDLVIYPIDPADPPEVPLYTAIRMSASAAGNPWYETTAYDPEDEDPDSPFKYRQWARDITQKVEVKMPADMLLKQSYDNDDSGSEGDDDNDGDDNDDESNDEESGDDDESWSGESSDEDEDEDEAANNHSNSNASMHNADGKFSSHEIHPHRFRMHGISVSPGGGATAVLASQHSTQHPERGGWHTVRSSVYFGYKPRRKGQPRQSDGVPSDPDNAIDSRLLEESSSSPTTSKNMIQVPALTTEAKLFEWLYGGGPEVPGVMDRDITTTTTTSTGAVGWGRTRDFALQAEKARLRALFEAARAQQMCDLCKARVVFSKGALSGCERGHYFSTCATSGLAVQMPGLTRSCGTCGLRTLRAEVLVAKMPVELRGEVAREVGDGVCGGCGGKFLN